MPARFHKALTLHLSIRRLMISNGSRTSGSSLSLRR